MNIDTFALAEPYTINESYDQVLFLDGGVTFSKWDGDRPVYKGTILLKPFSIKDGKRVYPSPDKIVSIEIDDLDKPQTDPKLEDARLKLLQAGGLHQMAAKVVKG